MTKGIDRVRRNSTTRWAASFAIVIACMGNSSSVPVARTPKTVFIIVDGIPADVIEKLDPPNLRALANAAGYTRAHVGGNKGTYSETPTISAVGYNSLLTGTWVNKHNVFDNDIKAPNYYYWNLFRIAKNYNPGLKTAIFSTWTDNRTKLVGEGLYAAGGLQLDYKFDGLELDTAKYPHDKGSAYIHRIDEAVAHDAAHYIGAEGPDLSWVYLEYTDDMGHRFGDSPQFHEAILTADKQIGMIWSAARQREEQFNEDWLIVITTDHGRGAATGKNHGGQSDRERSTWIVTNSTHLNNRFQESPGIVDIMPSICNHMGWPMPEKVKQESDGIPFIGPVDLADLSAALEGDQIVLHWKNLSTEKADKVEVYVTTTNHFREGGYDEYQKAGTVELEAETYTLKPKSVSTFYKILVKAPHNWANAWIVVKNK